MGAPKSGKAKGGGRGGGGGGGGAGAGGGSGTGAGGAAAAAAGTAGGCAAGNWEDKGGSLGGSAGGDKSRSATGAKSTTGPREGRSQLSSSAPNFSPSGYTYGASYDAGLQMMQPPMLPLWREYLDSDGTPYYYNSKTGLTQWERPPELDPPAVVPVPATATSSSAGVDKLSPPGAGASSRREAGGGPREAYGGPRDGGDRDRDRDRDWEEQPRGFNRGPADDGGERGGKGGPNRNRRRAGKGDDDGGGGGRKKKEGEFGPPGCNLFVFHLPDDWTDEDLHEYFAPHGNVVSAKVMKELGTGRSRGFGFVSYEDRVSAATAIKKMQGYKILGKRLKVEFKKGEQESHRGEGDDFLADEDEAGSRKAYPDDERLIGYLRAISAKNVVQSLKDSERAGTSERGAADTADPDLDT